MDRSLLLDGGALTPEAVTGIARGGTAVAIAPDLGERYLDTVYQTNWVQELYGNDVLESDELAELYSVA